jgi:aminoglycoside phosphotransferase (APT) family kinase protein
VRRALFATSNELWEDGDCVLKVIRPHPAKPPFLHDPAREATVYRLLADAGLGTPELRDTGDGWLLLERVEGVPLWQIGELGPWEEAARWLRRLHDRFRGVALPPGLLVHDEEWYRRWLRRARAFAHIDLADDRYEPVVQRLAAGPRTLVHGEAYASNILVAGKRVCAIDWECAASGAGVTDLAALVAGWPPRERGRLAAAYGVDDDLLAAASLHVSLQWLGWSEKWTPPSEHAQDWRAEAARHLENLER